MTPREKFSSDLEELLTQAIDLGKECYNRLDGVTKILAEENITNARILADGDKYINKLEHNINTKAVSMITAESPVATDLRLIIASIKVAMDLERISDNISNLAEVRKRVRITNDKLLLRLETMERLAILMLTDVYTAYKEKDIDLCLEILDRDKDIDSLFVQITTSDIFEETDLFVTGQSQLCAKYIERIGDHVKNIAEHVYFVITGNRFETF